MRFFGSGKHMHEPNLQYLRTSGIRTSKDRTSGESLYIGVWNIHIVKNCNSGKL